MRRLCLMGAAFAMALLAGCAQNGFTSVKPQARPAGLVPVVARPTSEESAALRSYLGQVQTAQLSQGLLREDGGGPDTPFTADTLVRNFERIVFYNEFESALQGRGGESPLRRWETPVRFGLLFGASVPPSQRQRMTEAVRLYAARLARISGHPIGLSAPPNFIVILADEDDRADTLNTAASLMTGISVESLAPLRDLRRETYCAVAAYATGANRSAYTRAVAVIRAENPGLLRTSCLHEELAQGLGLANDSRDARPSIFNDDDEFALLTDHDELLLTMLYDPRLAPGMTAAEAAPITRIIARELVQSPL